MNAMGIPKKTSFVDHVKLLRKTLDAVASLGCSWEGTRFGTYLRLLQEVSQWTFPAAVPNPALHRRIREASSQSHQLLRAAERWDSYAQPILIEKLKTVLKGGELPATGSDDDPARNALLELTAASYLARCGFKVALTAGMEDVSAEIEQWKFAVECKRPTSGATLQKNLKKLRKQLKDRRSRSPRSAVGIAVIGFDRVSGLSDGNAGVDDLRHLVRAVDETLHRGVARIGELAGREGLGREAAIGAIVLTAPVWVNAEGCSYTVEQLAAFPLNGEQSTQDLVRVLQPLFRRASRG